MLTSPKELCGLSFSSMFSGLWFAHPDPVVYKVMDLQAMAMSVYHEGGSS